ncbi:tail assembly chaperone [Gordonia phage Syleon]|nr:tail assembly chaperone [Gordonia Phage Sephiroth]YP_010246542.1 tail assembly chaperone [Gordonia phage Kudefre]YP_010246683.1 tail assembly chaperone [Gordonia phage Syleon]QGH75752.1 tail assembly chaperone [Gordonia phage Syleon]QNN99367.1 tail assembly chaperone [Gordonia Phage Sephiroth]UDL15256.1 tail assembly chaperone [Gordonia phage Kudefre]
MSAPNEFLFHELKQEIGIPKDIPLTEDILLRFPTRTQMREYALASTAQEKNRAIFGEHYDAIQELFDKEPPQLYLAFVNRIETLWFGKGANEVPGK